jgi:hypothetical protein
MRVGARTRSLLPTKGTKNTIHGLGLRLVA